MDDDLKIVISTELEADEKASANRISAQLPNIAKLINEKSTIKVSVSLDDSTINKNAQSYAQKINQAMKSQTNGIDLNINTSKIKEAMGSLQSYRTISESLVNELNQMGYAVESAAVETKKAKDGESELLSFTLQCVDADQNRVTLMRTYDTINEKVVSSTERLVANEKEREQIQERIAKQEEKDNNARITALSNYQIQLEKIRSSYTGETSVKPLVNADDLDTVEKKYQEISSELEKYRNTAGALSTEQKVAINEQIEELSQLAKSYQNIEYIAVKLQAKSVYVRNEEAVEDLNKYEEGLRSSGILTEDFQAKISTLREQLKTAFDRDSLTKFGDGFSTLTSAVGAFQERVRSANTEYTKLVNIEKEIAKTTKEINSAELSGKNTAGLQQMLALQESERAVILERLAAYQDITNYCQGATTYLKEQQMAEANAAIEADNLKNKAAEIAANMDTTKLQVEAVSAAMQKVSSPTAELIDKVKNLNTLFAAVENAQNAQEKIAAYETLQREITACNEQITLMRKIENASIFDAKFTSNLEKAKADLATIERTWSAFQKNDGLNSQFRILRDQLTKVNNQMDLTKWTAQFSAFKSEVKAAGLNMQSLADTFKNNVGKVMQWVSATTLLFRAFRLLKSAISTVVDLDTAMIDLKKTTNATTAEYQAFYETANETAKALGQTTEEIISQTAEWSRLGLTK